MNCRVVFYPLFEREVKRLAKHYPSFKDDLRKLVLELKTNHYSGVELSPGIRKMRMSIKSKGKGKSGGARVITLLATISEEDLEVGLHYIYDKSSRTSISDSEIRRILAKNGIL